ncbi:MAG: hypothetical protein KKA19_03030, partial [Candidatus Margulisbacteria bacterium]|nr:hypothetical protein [Candidatus Margulisiibacteriota bacterium]
GLISKPVPIAAQKTNLSKIIATPEAIQETRPVDLSEEIQEEMVSSLKADYVAPEVKEWFSKVNNVRMQQLQTILKYSENVQDIDELGSANRVFKLSMDALENIQQGETFSKNEAMQQFADILPDIKDAIDEIILPGELDTTISTKIAEAKTILEETVGEIKKSIESLKEINQRLAEIKNIKNKTIKEEYRAKELSRREISSSLQIKMKNFTNQIYAIAAAVIPENLSVDPKDNILPAAWKQVVSNFFAVLIAGFFIYNVSRFSNVLVGKMMGILSTLSIAFYSYGQVNFGNIAKKSLKKEIYSFPDTPKRYVLERNCFYEEMPWKDELGEFLKNYEERFRWDNNLKALVYFGEGAIKLEEKRKLVAIYSAQGKKQEKEETLKFIDDFCKRSKNKQRDTILYKIDHVRGQPFKRAIRFSNTGWQVPTQVLVAFQYHFINNTMSWIEGNVNDSNSPYRFSMKGLDISLKRFEAECLITYEKLNELKKAGRLTGLDEKEMRAMAFDLALKPSDFEMEKICIILDEAQEAGLGSDVTDRLSSNIGAKGGEIAILAGLNNFIEDHLLKIKTSAVVGQASEAIENFSIQAQQAIRNEVGIYFNKVTKTLLINEKLTKEKKNKLLENTELAHYKETIEKLFSKSRDFNEETHKVFKEIAGIDYNPEKKELIITAELTEENKNQLLLEEELKPYQEIIEQLYQYSREDRVEKYNILQEELVKTAYMLDIMEIMDKDAMTSYVANLLERAGFDEKARKAELKLWIEETAGRKFFKAEEFIATEIKEAGVFAGANVTKGLADYASRRILERSYRETQTMRICKSAYYLMKTGKFLDDKREELAAALEERYGLDDQEVENVINKLSEENIEIAAKRRNAEHIVSAQLVGDYLDMSSVMLPVFRTDKDVGFPWWLYYLLLYIKERRAKAQSTAELLTIKSIEEGKIAEKDRKISEEEIFNREIKKLLTLEHIKYWDNIKKLALDDEGKKQIDPVNWFLKRVKETNEIKDEIGGQIIEHNLTSTGDLRDRLGRYFHNDIGISPGMSQLFIAPMFQEIVEEPFTGAHFVNYYEEEYAKEIYRRLNKENMPEADKIKIIKEIYKIYQEVNLGFYKDNYENEKEIKKQEIQASREKIFEDKKKK